MLAAIGTSSHFDLDLEIGHHAVSNLLCGESCLLWSMDVHGRTAHFTWNPRYTCKQHLASIMVYGSTPFVGMAQKKNGGHIKSAQMTRLKCLC